MDRRDESASSKEEDANPECRGSLDMRERVVGVDRSVPLLDGSQATYVYLDNAATTPAFRDVMTSLEQLIPYYSSVHRGAGFKSRLCTWAYDQAHEIIAEFVHADPLTNTVVFGKNTTEAVNKLAYRYDFRKDAVVITSLLEHHSNYLPWLGKAEVVLVGATPEGRFDEEEFDRKLQEYGDRVAMVAVAGASNVTGFVQPVHRLARKAHGVGALMFVDAAQLAPHRGIDMKPDGDPEHIDFLALSGHKMYAPFGTGALIGPREFFEQGSPEYTGGGTVKAVTLSNIDWADPPDKDEAGSPNVPGAVAMAKAASILMDAGMDSVEQHEDRLVRYALDAMSSVPGMVFYGESDPGRSRERVGVIPFNIEGIDHALLAAVAGYEGGIGIRNGCFCAHPYVSHLLGLRPEESDSWRAQAVAGDRSRLPGMVRASFGCYSNTDDVDRLVDMLHRVATGDYDGEYEKSDITGEYFLREYSGGFEGFFRI